MQKIITVLIFLFSSQAFAETGAFELTQEKQSFLVDAMEVAQEYCTDDSGNFSNEVLSNTFIQTSDQEYTSCYDYLAEIEEIKNEFDDEIEAQVIAEYMQTAGQPQCPSDSMISAEVDRLDRLASGIDDHGAGCENRNGLASCTGEIVCNLGESITSALTFDLGRHIDQIAGVDMSICSGNSRGNCWSSLIQGVADNLTATWNTVSGAAASAWNNRGAAWDWIKRAPGRFLDWSSEKINDTYDYFTSFDDFSSFKMHLMSSLSDIDLENWFKEKALFVANLATTIYRSIENSFQTSLKENYGCQKWENNVCIEPLNIDCMNCNDYINGFCGFLGVATPEILLLYFSGGTSALARLGTRLATSTANGMKKMGGIMRAAASSAKNANWTNRARGAFQAITGRLSAMSQSVRQFRFTPKNFKRKVDLPDSKKQKAGKTCSWRDKP